MYITLTGNLGSGKSTICKILTERYGYQTFRTGMMQRELAQQLGLTTLEMNRLMNKDNKYDLMIDDKTRQFDRDHRGQDVVYDSRLAWYFVEHSFKVFLAVSGEESARRVFMDTSRGDVESFETLEEATEAVRARALVEDERYHQMYGINYFDMNNYDLVLDSSKCTPDVLTQVLLAEQKLYHDKIAASAGIKPETVCLLSPEHFHVPIPKLQETGDPIFRDEITVSYRNREFVLVSGLEVLQDAASQGIPLVRARLTPVQTAGK